MKSEATEVLEGDTDEEDEAQGSDDGGNDADSEVSVSPVSFRIVTRLTPHRPMNFTIQKSL